MMKFSQRYCLYDPAVFNMDSLIGQLGDFRIMSDHNNGLMELLTGHMKQGDYVVAGLGIQISRRFIRKYDIRF